VLEDAQLRDRQVQTAETHKDEERQETRDKRFETFDSAQRSQEGGPAPASSPLLPFSSSPLLSRRQRLNTVSEWETGLGGGVRAVGVGGGITGFGAGLVIIDDPVKSRAEAESKTYRDKVWEWFSDDLYTRLEPNASIILIQTRWHEDDLAGRVLKESSDGGEHWDVISLPALAEAENPNLSLSSRSMTANDDTRRSETAGLTDIVDGLGRRPGDALCPERFSRDDLLRIKRQLGTYSFSALYQQHPTPPEGGLFKRKWFSRIVDKPPQGLKWVRAYDLAVSTNTSADYTASFRCALDKQTGELYIADGFRKRIEFPEQRKFIVDRILNEPDTEHGIELALHGQAFIQDLRREHRLFGRAFRGVKVTADKFTRALSWANLAEEGKVILVRPERGRPRPQASPATLTSSWIDDFLDEITTFPNSSHDDQLDAVSLAVQMLEHRKHTAMSF
jgi:predicted phage terminase large subunit-like protein